jgi:non-ribosomal peptide synthetase component E (peptide arylation enzyme)
MPNGRLSAFGAGRYYLTGDTANREGYGYIFFSGRADDIIDSSGYRIGLFEVESALSTNSPRRPAARFSATCGEEIDDWDNARVPPLRKQLIGRDRQ